MKENMKKETLSNPKSSKTPSDQQVASDALLAVVAAFESGELENRAREIYEVGGETWGHDGDMAIRAIFGAITEIYYS